ncbi:MAG: DMT family transporter [Lachnospiraceae bacterium]|nr:DMT family transporter [Lachnospiraceae bacterium]
MWWMLCVLFFGVSKGIREIMKKLALKKHSVLEVLFVYTALSFIMVLPSGRNAGGLEPVQFLFVALKAFFVFLAWICSFKAIRKLPISLYGVLDLSRVLFATALGVFVLREQLGIFQVFGLVFVGGGLLLLKFSPKKKAEDGTASGVQISEEIKKDKTPFYVAIAFLSCILNAMSGLLDKILMRDMTSSQLQFWYMLFMVSYYGIYVLITKTKINPKTWLNGWIWGLSLLFVASDKALFIANGMPDSKITVMTLIKQSGCIVTILAGKFIFKEKNTGYKLFCAAVIVIGIVLGVVR